MLLLLHFPILLLSIQLSQTANGQTTNPAFTWVTPSTLDVSYPDGTQDRIKLKTTTSIPGVYDPCLFRGNFLREANASITVSGCQGDPLVEVTIFSSHLRGRHIFRITDGEVVNLNGNTTRNADDGVVPGSEVRRVGVVPGSDVKRVKRQGEAATGYVDDFLLPPDDNAPTLAGGAGGGAQGGGSRQIPSEVSINMKLGYEDSFLRQIGSASSAIEYINKVVTHGKSYFLLPSLHTKLHIKFPSNPVHYPGHDWQPDLHLHEARRYQKDTSVPHTFWCHKENTYYDGMAYVGGACRRDGALWGVSIQKWSGDIVYAAQTFAHETGHLFGMKHDFFKEGSSYASYPSRPDSKGNQCKNTGLMSYGDPLRVTEWSTCSLEDFKAWYDDRGFTCLKKETSTSSNDELGDTIEIVSRGDGGVHQDKRMGAYTKTKQTVEGHPVYQQTVKKLQRRQFLFVGPNGSWRVGPDTSTYKGSGLKNSLRSPTPPRTGWQYRHEGKWVKDPSIQAILKVKGSKVPELLSVSSSSFASSAQGPSMGVYRLQPFTHNGHPVWKQQQGDNFLFVTNNKFWGIGKDLNSIIVGIYLDSDSLTDIPDTQSGDWWYYDNGWKQDATLSIEQYTEIPQYVEVGSRGGASSIHSAAMGTYELQTYKHNNRPVWKKDDLYLFATSNDYWGIGSDINSITVLLYQDKQPAPELPGPGAWYYYDSEWKQDQTVSVDATTAIPQYVEVSSVGGASSIHSAAMGTYELQTYKHNNRPVWKKDDLYLFATSNDYWGIGSDINSITVLLYQDKQPAPEMPGPGAWYYYDSEWKQDQTVRIQASTESGLNIIYEDYSYADSEFPIADFDDSDEDSFYFY